MSSGLVPRETVLQVLKAHGVDVSDRQGGQFLLIKNDIIEARVVCDPVPKRTLQYFQRKFKIPIHHFYNPNLAPTIELPAAPPKFVPKKAENF